MSIRFLFSASLLILSTTGLSAFGQIAVDKMAPAQTFEAGILGAQQSGLDSTLWQNTDAVRATQLLNNIPARPNHFARPLIKNVLYTGGVPPQAKSRTDYQNWQAARMEAVLRLGDLASFDTLMTKTAEQNLSPNPALIKARFERALLGGQNKTACERVDANREDRKSPYWAKARAFCHLVRGEGPAAELTVDLLQREGAKDPAYYALINHLTGAKNDVRKVRVRTPLQTALLRLVLAGDKQLAGKWPIKALPPVLDLEMAKDKTETENERRLQALLRAAPVLDAASLDEVLTGFATPENPGQTELLKTKKWTSRIWGTAWALAHNSDAPKTQARAIAALLGRADHYGFLPQMTRALQTEITTLTADIQAEAAPLVFARLAAREKDLSRLRLLFMALSEDNPARARIALASDALGGGFVLGELGVDIKTRLSNKKTRARAMRDSYIAAALGARISKDSEDYLLKARPGGTSVPAGQILLLQDAAGRGAKAETYLRAALIFNKVQPAKIPADNFGTVLRALGEAGLNAQAGQLAALDFLAP